MIDPSKWMFEETIPSGQKYVKEMDEHSLRFVVYTEIL